MVVADTDAAGAAELAAEIGGSSWVVDLLDTDALTDAALAAPLDGVGILGNNAGIQHVRPIQEFDPAGFGRIINVSSVHGIRASAFTRAQVCAKHGLEGLSKVTALEGGAYGVTSTCVAPGYLRTPLVEKRLVEPEEVASLIFWLVSREDAMVTGAGDTMDGGWSAR